MAKLTVIKQTEVLSALRLWHGGDVAHWPLAHLRLRFLLSSQEQEYGSLAEAGAAAQNRAILNYGLTQLKARSPESEDLLRERFEHGREVLAVANQLNLSESSLFYRQRQAIKHLTEILIALEDNAGAEWQQHMISRLPLPSYNNELVGIAEPHQALLTALLNSSDHYILAIDGIGGIGKTALADKLAHDLINAMKFDEIAWVTAKHTHLSSRGRLQIESGRSALTFPMLIDRLANQFDLPQQETRLQRQRAVRQYLKNRQCMIVIDNLETAADYRTLLPELKKWQNPSKFLLTSRLRLLDEPGVFSISLQELDQADAMKLIRLEAKNSGFVSLADASDKDLKQIYDAVGGNPLALKLVIGQLKFHSLSRVLKRFARSAEQTTHEGIFDYIYQEIWDDLQEESKITLLALTQAGESGFTFDHLAKISGMTEASLGDSLERLILLSLVDLSGSLLERRYRLHRLTEVFLLRSFAE